jgi:hypothetical protein
MMRYKFFKHEGLERTPETDKLAEELAAHALRDQYPMIEDLAFQWVRHNQPDCWLLFVSGSEREENE